MSVDEDQLGWTSYENKSQRVRKGKTSNAWLGRYPADDNLARTQL
jgi:hypothetical protein